VLQEGKIAVFHDSVEFTAQVIRHAVVLVLSLCACTPKVEVDDRISTKFNIGKFN
jgi:hypothetical protein